MRKTLLNNEIVFENASSHVVRSVHVSVGRWNVDECSSDNTVIDPWCRPTDKCRPDAFLNPAPSVYGYHVDTNISQEYSKLMTFLTGLPFLCMAGCSGFRERLSGTKKRGALAVAQNWPKLQFNKTSVYGPVTDRREFSIASQQRRSAGSERVVSMTSKSRRAINTNRGSGPVSVVSDFLHFSLSFPDINSHQQSSLL